MNRIVFHVSAIGLLVALCGCTVVPPLSPIERKPKQEKDQNSRLIKLPLSEVIARYAPPSFQFDPAADVNYATPILFDTSLPWSMGFERALADAHIDPTALRTPAAPTQKDELIPENPQVSVGAVDATTSQSNDAGSTDASPKASANGVATQSSLLYQSLANAKSAEPSVAACSKDAVATGEPVQVWEAKSGLSLRDTLRAWSVEAGWEVRWEFIDEQTNEITDMTLGGGKKCRGTYREAVRTLIDAFPEGAHIHARLLLGNSPPLLRIFNKDRENQ